MVFNKVRSPTGTQVVQPDRSALARQPERYARAALGVGRRRPAAQPSWPPQAVPDRTAPARQPDLPDLYHTDTLDIDQRLKITSLTFLFTDLRSSTELYERVGDLVAFDLVRSHFRVLLDIVAEESGAVIKTIGDAVMATFLSPDQAVNAALRMRQGMRSFNAAHGRSDLYSNRTPRGPCLAVLLNERQDFFGQTVNVASRVQGAANSTAILATSAIVHNTAAAELLERSGIEPLPRPTVLRGLTGEVMLYEIP